MKARTGIRSGELTRDGAGLGAMFAVAAVVAYAAAPREVRQTINRAGLALLRELLAPEAPPATSTRPRDLSRKYPRAIDVG